MEWGQGKVDCKVAAFTWCSSVPLHLVPLAILADGTMLGQLEQGKAKSNTALPGSMTAGQLLWLPFLT